ncbi:glycosyltransferase [Aeromicrobium sp. CF3.5]|uniref:glycosyltransferase n=1 Tax=Aeromicrobium sp. CF3.5 TaxID=3373078 RepID=UPI003EE81523
MFGSDFWARYLEVFDEVVVAARVDERETRNDGVAVEADGISVVPLRYYVGLLGLLRNYRGLRRDIKKALLSDDALLLRAPGPISAMFQSQRRRARPYAVEVVGDPYEVLTTLGWPVGRILRRLAARRMRTVVGGATAVSYVSETILPERYPPDRRAHVTSYSSVTLPPEAYADREATRADVSAARLIVVGSMEQEYKGIDVVLRSFAALDRAQFGSLRILGDGKYRAKYESLAMELGVDQSVSFAGLLPTSVQVREEFDHSDLFVSGSRSEGLPRAMIEAMARRLPCIGTTVGGTPDLLPSWAMCPADDEQALTDLLNRFASSENRAELAQVCRDRADDYALDILNKRRSSLYEHLAGCMHEWNRQSARG